MINHVHEALLELIRILELLKPGRIIVVETPNSMDFYFVGINSKFSRISPIANIILF